MQTLLLLPDQASEIANSPAGRGARLGSPSTLFGTIEAQQPRFIAARWSSLNGFEYAYLLAFYRTAAKRNAGEFLISLPIRRGAFESCRAKFMGGVTVGGLTGGTASVEAQMAVIPQAVPYALSAAATALLGQITTEIA